MGFIELSTGVIDGAGTLLLTKNEAAFYIEKCTGATFINLSAFGVRKGARWRATIAALRFIWFRGNK